MTGPSSPTGQELRQGQPNWIELTSSDLPAARAFYTAVFNWQFIDQGEDFMGYNMVLNQGRPVAGAIPSRPDPDHPQSGNAWIVFLKVDSMDDTLEKVRSAGGQVLADPAPVPDAGLWAIVSDPAGAVLGVWQPAPFTGFGRTGDPGTPVWFEVLSRDFDEAATFYEEVFDWELTYVGDDGQVLDGSAPAGGFSHAVNDGPGKATAGIYDAASHLPPEAPSHWRMYLAVDDLETTLEKIRDLGGTIVEGPRDSHWGRLAAVTDPQGVHFHIVEA